MGTSLRSRSSSGEGSRALRERKPGVRKRRFRVFSRVRRSVQRVRTVERRVMSAGMKVAVPVGLRVWRSERMRVAADWFLGGGGVWLVSGWVGEWVDGLGDREVW